MRHPVTHPAPHVVHAGVSAVTFGTLLIGLGALFALGGQLTDHLRVAGVTYGNTVRTPSGRLSVACAIVGSLEAASGSVVLAVATGLSLVLVIVALIGSAALICLALAVVLRRHLALMARQDSAPIPGFLFCLRHLGWRPPPK